MEENQVSIYIKWVALLAEGVDRNKSNFVCIVWSIGSLSSRRAWIEIQQLAIEEAKSQRSLSSRRAWIEIISDPPLFPVPIVALLAEGVDRNSPTRVLWCRSEPVALLAEGVDRNG